MASNWDKNNPSNKLKPTRKQIELANINKKASKLEAKVLTSKQKANNAFKILETLNSDSSDNEMDQNPQTGNSSTSEEDELFNSRMVEEEQRGIKNPRSAESSTDDERKAKTIHTSIYTAANDPNPRPVGRGSLHRTDSSASIPASGMAPNTHSNSRDMASQQINSLANSNSIKGMMSTSLNTPPGDKASHSPPPTSSNYVPMASPSRYEDSPNRLITPNLSAVKPLPLFLVNNPLILGDSNNQLCMLPAVKLNNPLRKLDLSTSQPHRHPPYLLSLPHLRNH